MAETRLGAALAGRRDKVVLATKCGRYDVAKFDFSAARIRGSIEESLRRLRTDYLDVFLAHDIEFVDARQIIEEAIPTMRALQREGKARFIGITGLQLNILRKSRRPRRWTRSFLIAATIYSSRTWTICSLHLLKNTE